MKVAWIALLVGVLLYPTLIQSQETARHGQDIHFNRAFLAAQPGDYYLRPVWHYSVGTIFSRGDDAMRNAFVSSLVFNTVEGIAFKYTKAQVFRNVFFDMQGIVLLHLVSKAVGWLQPRQDRSRVGTIQ